MTSPTPAPSGGAPVPRPAPQAPGAPPPAERRGLSGCAIAGIVVGVLAVLVLVGGLVLARSLGDGMRGKQARFTCQNNLHQLAAIWVATPARGSARSGPAVFLEWRKRGTHIRPGQEGILLCPVDPDAVVRDTPEWRARWDDVNLDDPGRGLCSYAVRDFAKHPVAEAGAAPVPIAACLHHTETALGRGGAVVAFSDASARWLGYEELGISSGEELVAGPASKAPLLRELVAPPASPRRR